MVAGLLFVATAVGRPSNGAKSGFAGPEIKGAAADRVDRARTWTGTRGECILREEIGLEGLRMRKLYELDSAIVMRCFRIVELPTTDRYIDIYT